MARLQKYQINLINLIAERAAETAAFSDMTPPEAKRTVVMDLLACCEHCPLKLEELFKADAFNFAHDILGINRHLDHDSYQLRDHFWPRYAA